MSASTRVALTSDDARTRIVHAARAVFAAEGYDRAATSAIAAAAGVAEGTIYRHFSSKRELLIEVIRAFYEPLIDETARVVASLRDPRERLRFLIHRQLRAFAEQPDLCRLLIAEGRRMDGYFASPLADLNRRYTQLAMTVVADGVDRGVFREDVPVELVRHVVYGAIEHAAWKVAMGHGELDVDDTADRLTEIIVDGIAAEDLATRVARLERLVEDRR